MASKTWLKRQKDMSPFTPLHKQPPNQSATEWRDCIARMMHTQYLEYLAQRDADGADLAEAQHYGRHALTILETAEVGPSIRNYLQHFS
jgi:DNA-binding GntR family transcriptional regulator